MPLSRTARFGSQIAVQQLSSDSPLLLIRIPTAIAEATQRQKAEAATPEETGAVKEQRKLDGDQPADRVQPSSGEAGASQSGQFGNVMSQLAGKVYETPLVALQPSEDQRARQLSWS